MVSKFWLVSSRFVFNASFTFNWYSSKFLLVYLCVHLHLVSWCTTLIYFLIGIMFVLISPLEVFFVSDKKGKNMFYWFSLTPLLMIDKKGEKYLSLYACFYSIWVYMHVFILVSREFVLCFVDICIKNWFAVLFWKNMFMKRRNNLFGIKSLFFIWYQEHVHCFMHVYAYSCLIFIAYIYCLLLCMS